MVAPRYAALDGPHAREVTVEGPASVDAVGTATSAAGHLRRLGRCLIGDDIVVAAVAMVLGWWRLTLNGLGNSYYTAASLTAAHSLRALFFASFDPAGVMAIDKPPLGLIGPALAIHWFGLSSWTVLAPQGVMFVVGALVAHRAFRRWFHRGPARLATAVLLLTPIDVAVARNNNPDELLVLLTIVGLVLLVESIRHDHLGWVVGAGLAVGLAFTTKQLQAVVGVPATVSVLMALSNGGWRRRLARTFTYATVVAGSSLAWIVAVDHVARGARPYVSNSVDDTEWSLAFGFNGTHRVRQLRHAPSWVPRQGGWATGVGKLVARFLPQRNLFGDAYLTQTSWLLVAAVLGAVMTIAVRHSRVRRITLVLLGWTTSQLVVFAYLPGKFSPYYLAPVVPGVAALIAATTDTFLFARNTGQPRPRGRSDTMAISVVVAAVAITAALATQRIRSWTEGLSLAFAAVAIGASVLAPVVHRFSRRDPVPAGSGAGSGALSIAAWQRVLQAAVVGAIVALLLVVPARWTLATVLHRQDPIAPGASLDAPPQPTAQLQTVASNDAHLLQWVTRHDRGTTMVLGTPRISDSAQLVLDGTTPAPLGGFFGTDPYPRLTTFTGWIATHQLRWVALPELPPGRRVATVPPGMVARPWGPWVRAHCAATPTTVWGGADQNTYWDQYRHAPLHSPLALYDCQHLANGGTP